MRVPFALVLASLVACGGQVPITVQNASGRDLRDVVLAGSGFADTLADLAAGQSVTVRVKPRGESGLAVSFMVDGRQIAQPASGYFEGAGRYAVKATIDSALGVNVHSALQ
jgi:hypothetical protein